MGQHDRRDAPYVFGGGEDWLALAAKWSEVCHRTDAALRTQRVAIDARRRELEAQRDSISQRLAELRSRQLAG